MTSSATALFSRHTPGGMFVIQEMETHPNNVLFVNSAHAAATNAISAGKSPDTPFSTLAYVQTNAATLSPALTAGDVIYLHPDHVETISGAAGIACATAGVKIIGLGWGANRPTFTFSATGSTWTITAASVYIKNIRVTSSVNELVSMFSSSASDLVLDAVDYIDPGSALETLQFLITTADSDRMTLKNSRHNATTAGATAQLWVRLIGCDSPSIFDNVFTLTLENGATDATISGDASVRSFYIARNTIVQLGGTTQASAILFTNGATGLAIDNRCAVGSSGLPGIVDVGTSGYACENYALNTADKSGIVDPVADS
jgi:hypothetical protein